MQKLIAGLAIVLAILLIALGLRAASILDGLQATLSNGLYSGREIGNDIVIVALDEKTLLSEDEGGMGELNNLTRVHYARVLEEIEADAPAVVMFDILFSKYSDGLSGDSIIEISKENTSFEGFADEILDYAMDPHPYDQAFAAVLAMYENVYLLKWIAGEPYFDGESFVYQNEIKPIDLFANVAHLGFPNAPDASDENENTSVIYAIPTQFEVNGKVEEHMDLKLVREYLAAQSAQDAHGATEEVAGAQGAGAGAEEDLKIPVEDGQMLINYAAESYSFPMYSFADVYSGKLPAGTFEGKIVLIGATAAILQDRHLTPIDRSVPMPGVEIQANVIQTILDGAFLRHQGMGRFAAMLSVIVLAGVAAFLYLPVPVGAGVLAALVAAFPFLAKWSFGRGVILDLIWPVFALVAAYLAVLAYRNFTEFREKRKLKSAFGHYVSPELVEEITENPDSLKLGGERRELSVMFLDIENFTGLAESLEAQEVVGIINTYFDALAQVIIANGGTVDKFEGDAIMALFGAPIPSEDHGVRACEAAVALRSKMVELNKETGRDLRIRIGIATGEAIVGNMGSAERFDYTAMGDTVNTASRLEGGNKFYGTRILVNGGTVESVQSHPRAGGGVAGGTGGGADEGSGGGAGGEAGGTGGGAFVFRRVDRVRLKGKSDAIDIYELLRGTGAGAGTGASAVAGLNLVALVGEWHEALEYYRNQNWAEAEARLLKLQKAMPADGPVKTYLERIAWLKKNPPAGWDGTWGFENK